MRKGQVGIFVIVAIVVIIIAVGVVFLFKNRPVVESQCLYTDFYGPDPNCTPGGSVAITLDVLCAKDYPEGARDVSAATKREVYAMYGVKNPRSGEYQIDHLIPLGLGGSNDISNLWPEPLSPYPGYKEKDVAERKLHELVCNGKMPLASAQYMMSHNWKINVGLYT